MSQSLSKNDLALAANYLHTFKERVTDPGDKSVRTSMDKLSQAFSSPQFNSLLDRYFALPEYKAKPPVKAQYAGSTIGSQSIRSERTDTMQQQSENLFPHFRILVDFDRDWEYLEVTINKPKGATGGFGFSIAGGNDVVSNSGDPSIFITKVAPGGLADQQGVLRVNDVLLSVNGADLQNTTNMNAVTALKSAGESLVLVIKRRITTNLSDSLSKGGAVHPYNMPLEEESSNMGDPRKGDYYAEDSFGNEDVNWYEVTFERPNLSTSLGFSIAGGRDSHDPDGQGGIYITKIHPGGVADQQGGIQLGDKLVEVNGIDLSHMSHSEAVDVLRNTGKVVRLVISRSAVLSELSAQSPPEQQGMYAKNPRVRGRYQ